MYLIKHMYIISYILYIYVYMYTYVYHIIISHYYGKQEFLSVKTTAKLYTTVIRVQGQKANHDNSV